MKPAPLLIDFQEDFLTAPGLQPSAGMVVERAAELLRACRARGVLIAHVWTTVQRDPDNRMPHWKAADLWRCEAGTHGHNTPAALRPIENEAIIHKQFFSGFHGPALSHVEGADLDRILRSHQCDTLFFAGVHLHGCVRATAFDAYARGLHVYVAEDAVASDDPLHSAITRRYLAKRTVRFIPVNTILKMLDEVQAGRQPMSNRPEIQRRAPHDSSRALQPVPIAVANEISTATAAARQALRPWQAVPIQQRAATLRRLAQLLLDEAAGLANLITNEIGKPITMSRAEVQRSAAILHAVADYANQPLETRPGPGARWRYQPLGVVAVITPWNNPLAIPIGKIAPALLFGNTVVWKPAPAGTAITHAILNLCIRAGWQADGQPALQLITGDQGTATKLAEDPSIDAVTVSGSSQAGLALQEICDRRHIPFQAELGGNNAAIVWDNADLQQAARQISAGAFGFSGQRCTANRRAIVCDKCFDAFLPLLHEATAALHWGDPHDKKTSVGPVLDVTKRDQVAALLQRAANDGLPILIPHAQQPDYAALMQRGAYLSPTIVVCDNPAHEIVQEETFGPVLVVQRARAFDHAIALNNGVRQGLIAALFSTSSQRQQQFLAEAQAGVLKLNQATADADAKSPLGGWKASGVGPAEHGPSDREFFCRVQTIYGEDAPDR